MKKRMLSEIEKKQLLLNKIRQIIREEIERSLEESEGKGFWTIVGGGWSGPAKEKPIAVDLNDLYNKSQKITNKSKIQDAIKKYIIREYPLHYVIPTVTDDIWFKNTLNGIKFIRDLDQELYNKTGEDLKKTFKEIELLFRIQFNP